MIKKQEYTSQLIWEILDMDLGFLIKC